jgi:hypothetical protein
MRTLADRDLLQVWEKAYGLSQPRQALMLLAAAYPEMAPAALLQLSVGQRDTRLLSLREQLFGPRLVSLARCPICGEPLELDFDIADIRVGDAMQNAPLLETNSQGLWVTHWQGYDIAFRAPNSADLMALATQSDVGHSRDILLRRCVGEALRAGDAIDVGGLPDEVLLHLSQQIERADPQASTQLALTCPACGHRWLAPFNIARFLWAEIDDWAQRLMHHIHIIASAYGWSEADILALSSARRQMYLDLIGA